MEDSLWFLTGDDVIHRDNRRGGRGPGRGSVSTSRWALISHSEGQGTWEERLRQGNVSIIFTLKRTKITKPFKT